MPEIEEKPTSAETDLVKDESQKVEEMLQSPTWEHRKQEIKFLPFDPEKDESKGRKSSDMQRINLFGFNLLKAPPQEDKRERSSKRSSRKLSVKISPCKASPQTTAVATGAQTVKSDRSLDDFEQYVKYKQDSPTKSVCSPLKRSPYPNSPMKSNLKST